MRLSLVIKSLYPQAVPLEDFQVANTGGEDFITKWNTPKLGTQPTLTQLEAAWPAAQLQSMQAKQNALNFASYQAAIQGPVSYTSAGGITAMYQADPQSIANLYASLATWQLKGATPTGFYWKAADNSKTPFTYADLQGLAQAMGEPGEAAWVKWEGLKAQVKAATTVAAVQAVARN
jgi:hypothetical protein